MFPNPRRNKIEMMYSTLSPNTLTPSEQGLGMSPEAADVVNFARTRMNREAMNQVAGADAQDQADWVNSGGLAPSGRVYRSPTGAPTPETEAIIAAGRQRIDPAGPDMSHIMRSSAAAPSRVPNTDAPLPASQELLDKIRMDRESKQRSLFGQSQGSTTEQDALRPTPAPFDAGAYAIKVKSLATPQAWAQKARYDAAQAKQPEIQDNLSRQAMAESVMRKGRIAGNEIDPLTARLFVDANSGSTGNGDGGRKFSGGMNAAYQALYPNAAKTAIAADAAAQQSADRNVLERSKADAARSAAQADVAARLGASREATLQQLHAQAKSLEEKAAIERQIRDNQQATLAAVAKLQGVDSGLLDGLMPSSSGLPVQPASTGSASVPAIDVSTPSGIKAAEQTRVPTEAEINDVLGQPRSYLDQVTNSPLPPSARPQPGETGTSKAVAWDQTQQAVQRAMDPARSAASSADLPGIDATYNNAERAHLMYQKIKQQNPGIPDQAIRRAIADHLKEPRVVDGTWNWDELMRQYNPKTPYFQGDPWAEGMMMPTF